MTWEVDGNETLFFVSVSADENVISRKVVAMHFPDIEFTTCQALDLHSQKAAGEFQIVADPVRHLGRFLGYTSGGHVVLNSELDLVVWSDLGKKFDHPKHGSDRDFEKLRRRQCEHLYDELPCLEDR